MDVIPAGTHFDAGCTPDGACWEAFTSARACIVRYYDDMPRRPHLKGLTLSSDGGCVILVDKTPRGGEGWTNPKDRWTVEGIKAHEVGHDNCATRHKDGSVWCGEGAAGHE